MNTPLWDECACESKYQAKSDAKKKKTKTEQ